MRTLVATTLSNAKGRDIYCTARKIDERYMKILRGTERSVLEDLGFTFIKMISLEYPNVKGYAIFFEGHLHEMERALNTVYSGKGTLLGEGTETHPFGNE